MGVLLVLCCDLCLLFPMTAHHEKQFSSNEAILLSSGDDE